MQEAQPRRGHRKKKTVIAPPPESLLPSAGLLSLRLAGSCPSSGCCGNAISLGKMSLVRGPNFLFSVSTTLWVTDLHNSVFNGSLLTINFLMAGSPVSCPPSNPEHHTGAQ